MKPVAIVIEEVSIVSMVQADGVNSQLGKRVQFIRLRDAVVVFVNPQEKVWKYVIPLIDDSISVAAVLWLIELGQSEKAVPVIRFRLRSKVAEEFLTTIDLSVVVSIESKECVVRVCRCPCNPDGFAIAGNIEKDPVLGGR
jgi:hypothetical protein